ncbi:MULTISPECIES: S-methyl-5-thioribose kinase [unclassified Paenibacillus]|uniref:S-methyl-5-thioribose kinase n=1 Tax=unclassified Paenibacillus TaxID=185978 RepID=UPI001AE60754|nr:MULTISPECIES: S-methyl-5-thioribose kinase [unclassified Paenibacillus]MBP1154554.1 5-methylthioribose kinase [Paenibacillus sp. PvP091]MBP1170062.1 5-methylthioribose kinase [Paenibacillus sp. PvR098]MBP2441090.1 5-methylthioribose kinase [Paenibacillus sp. PvP052]
MPAYHALTETEAIEYARQLPNLFQRDSKLSSREIGDGNLNLVFHISEPSTGKSIILKQALPYAKVVGESWPLTLDRARIESEALMIQESLCPDLVPHVHDYEPDLALTVMQDLSDHVIMRRGLIERNKYPLFAGHIGTFLARTLFYTSDLGMNQQDKKERVKRFINPELCKITEDLIFDDPYTDSPNNNVPPAIRDAVEAVWSDTELHLEVAILREKFLTHAQALLHGDLHTGSIFIKPDSTKVIDPEFAYYGPMGFDIGALFANLLLNFAAQEGWSKDSESRQDFRTYLTQTIRDVWVKFYSEFRTLWNEHGVDRMAKTPGYQDIYMKRVLQDTFGFTGCKIVRRVHGLSQVADINTIEDESAKESAQRIALAIGTSLIKWNRQADSIEQIIDIAEKTVR